MTRRRVFENTEAQDAYQSDMKRIVFFRRKVRHYFPELLMIRPGRRLYGCLMIVAFFFLLAKFALLSSFPDFNMSREIGFRTRVEDESTITNNVVIEQQNLPGLTEILPPDSFQVSLLFIITSILLHLYIYIYSGYLELIDFFFFFFFF
jgi:hypothetical protein